jgi:hypothetical protein
MTDTLTHRRADRAGMLTKPCAARLGYGEFIYSAMRMYRRPSRARLPTDFLAENQAQRLASTRSKYAVCRHRFHWSPKGG